MENQLRIVKGLNKYSLDLFNHLAKGFVVGICTFMISRIELTYRKPMRILKRKVVNYLI